MDFSKMNFSQFLIVEARDESIGGNDGYRKEITATEAVELIKKHCKNVDFNKPLYRGMGYTKLRDYLLIEGQKGGRQSQNTSNHYTLIIDKLLKDYHSYAPQRSKSIICTNSIKKAHNYGNSYIILPFDDTEIGMCEHDDMWESYVRLAGMNLQISEMNLFLKKIIKSPKSYQEIVDAIATDMKSDKPSSFAQKMLDTYIEDYNIDEDDEDLDYKEIVEESLYTAYDPEHALNMKFGTYKELNISDIDTDHEFWIGGKVIAIHYLEWKYILRQLID
jgi:hypothetical protein